MWNESDEDRLVFIVDGWHPALASDAQRRAALDGDSLARYERALFHETTGGELPVEEDILANRRRKVVY